MSLSKRPHYDWGKKSNPPVFYTYKGLRLQAAEWAARLGKTRGRLSALMRGRDPAAVLAALHGEGEMPPAVGVSSAREASARELPPRDPERSRRQSRIFLEFRGRRQSMREWANELKIPYQALQQRIASGMPAEEALTRPIAFNPASKAQATCAALAAKERAAAAAAARAARPKREHRRRVDDILAGTGVAS